MVAAVSWNSFGTKSTRTSDGALTPAPPLSNCLGKMVFVEIACAAGDTIAAPTGATYYLLGAGASNPSCLTVYYKNGEASEPTPSISISGGTGAQKVAQISVLDITGGTFPIVASAGDARLATANSRNGTIAGINFTALASHIGGGYLMEFASKVGFSGATPTAVATTAGFTQAVFAISPAGNWMVLAAQLRAAATVAAGSEAAHAETITGNSDATNLTAFGLTVEMAVIQAGAGGPFTGKFGAPFEGKIAA